MGSRNPDVVMAMALALRRVLCLAFLLNQAWISVLAADSGAEREGGGGGGGGAEVEGELNQIIQKLESRISQLEEQINVKQASDPGIVMCGVEQLWRPLENRPVNFTTVHIEDDSLGGYMDGRTGVFTAGVSGIYSVSFSGRCELDPGEMLYISLKTTSGKYDEEEKFFVMSFIDRFFTGSTMVSCTAHRYLTLEEGEELYLDYYEIHDRLSGPGIENLSFCVALHSH